MPCCRKLFRTDHKTKYFVFITRVKGGVPKWEEDTPAYSHSGDPQFKETLEDKMTSGKQHSGLSWSNATDGRNICSDHLNFRSPLSLSGGLLFCTQKVNVSFHQHLYLGLWWRERVVNVNSNTYNRRQIWTAP